MATASQPFPASHPWRTHLTSASNIQVYRCDSSPGGKRETVDTSPTLQRRETPLHSLHASWHKKPFNMTSCFAIAGLLLGCLQSLPLMYRQVVNPLLTISRKSLQLIRGLNQKADNSWIKPHTWIVIRSQNQKTSAPFGVTYCNLIHLTFYYNLLRVVQNSRKAACKDHMKFQRIIVGVTESCNYSLFINQHVNFFFRQTEAKQIINLLYFPLPHPIMVAHMLEILLR